MDKKNRVSKVLAPEELAAFCLQLSYPTRAGIPSVDSIGLLLEETQIKAEKEILSFIYDKLKDGSPFADALESAGCFPHYMLQMVKIGQSSGNLDKVLEGLVDHYQKEAQRSAAIRRASMGPAVMLIVMSILLLVLVVKILPVFQQVFRQMGTQLSSFAQALMQASDVIRVVMPVISVLLLVFAVVLWVLLRGRSGTTRVFGIADKIFFKGKLGLAMSQARFASSLSLTISSGMAFDGALTYTENLLKESELGDAVAQCRKRVAEGETFPSAAKQAGIIVGVESGILAAGFKAGVLDRALEELAIRYQQKSEAILDNFVGRIEPGLIVILSITVGLALLSVMLPLIGMLSSMGV